MEGLVNVADGSGDGSGTSTKFGRGKGGLMEGGAGFKCWARSCINVLPSSPPLHCGSPLKLSGRVVGWLGMKLSGRVERDPAIFLLHSFRGKLAPLPRLCHPGTPRLQGRRNEVMAPCVGRTIRLERDGKAKR
jgi:hypothetical protein